VYDIRAECFLEDLILGAEVLHQGLLLAVEPTGENDEQELPGLDDEGHGPPNAAVEQKRAASGMAVGVSGVRNSRLLDLEKLKNYGHFGFS
jgi:hypothetical protein